ncbi:MAG: AMP-binding protein, partial [Acidimicrobiales bacterium]
MHGGLDRSAKELGKRVALRSTEGSWTFAELDGRANALAHHLAAAGVGPGVRVAVLMANRVEFVAAVHAVSKLGEATVLLSPAWKAAEVTAALALTGPRHAVADGAGSALLVPLLGAGAVTDVDHGPAAALAPRSDP